MRKCQSCGYLVLGEGESCKHCGAALPLVAAAALVATGVRAEATASVPPVPPAPSPFGPHAGPPPLALTSTIPFIAPPPPLAPTSGRAPVAREYWTPPTPESSVAAKQKHTVPRALIALISITSMALGWVGVDRLLQNNAIPSGTSAFVAGRGVDYSSPDHTFEARFPSTPTVERKVIAVASASATMNLAQVQTDDYEVVAASMVLPVSVPPAQVDAALHDILNAGATATGSKIASEKPITKYGAQGIEVRAKVEDGYDARLMVLISGPRVYFLGVHAKVGTSKLYDALVASLIMY